MTTKAEFLAVHGRPFGAVPTRTDSGLCLHRDNKTGSLSKIRHSAQGTSWENMIPNVFPLPAGPPELGGTCPGATPSCVDCYAVHGLEMRRPFAALVAENLRILHEAHEAGRLVDVLLEAVDLSASAAAKYGKAPTFRWHSDGDLFSPWYAAAIRKTALARPDVHMWIYTRSFRKGADYLHALIGRSRPANLHVFLSVDVNNVADAARKLDQYTAHGVRAAILADSDEEQTELETRLAVRSIVCPATAAYVHDRHGSPYLTKLDGRRTGIRQVEMAQGACAACGFCLRPESRSVTFRLHGGNRSSESAVRILSRRLVAA